MTTKANRWLLPDGVDEILPPRADQLETLRRDILDLYRTWGYDLIKTSLIEFLDSLLIVPSHELQLSTFKIVDQLSGKSMGVRADISSQAARIDAHILQKDGPVRLCYTDSVLRTRPNGHLGSRSPQLIGAELYGHKGTESDIEVITLMLNTLHVAGIEKPLLSLGHSAICSALLALAKLPAEIEGKLFTAMQNKASTDISQLLDEAGLSEQLTECLATLPRLHGEEDVIARAMELFSGLDAGIDTALDQIQQVTSGVKARFPDQPLYFDLCELGGYDYHNGIIFSACVSGHGEAIAKGGRYDSIGEIFGRNRAATGFDADLKTLLSLSKRAFPSSDRIYAPALQDQALAETIAGLRAEGQVVVQGLVDSQGNSATAAEMDCNRQLVMQDDRWTVVALN